MNHDLMLTLLFPYPLVLRMFPGAISQKIANVRPVAFISALVTLIRILVEMSYGF